MPIEIAMLPWQEKTNRQKQKQQKKAKNLHLRRVICHNSYNHKYIKILESDWSSAALIWALIGQLHTLCLCNWTVRFIKRVLVHLNGLSFYASSLVVAYINLANSLHHCHFLLKFCSSYDEFVIELLVVQFCSLFQGRWVKQFEYEEFWVRSKLV